MFQWDARALEILNTLERAGHQAVLVGGCVRDALLGREPHDYDAAVSAPPEEILVACRSKFKCIPTGLAHGTVTVVHSGLPVEVTAFRKEGTYSDHRHPDRVEYTSRLEEDLARRDFTVNAMAWDRSGLIDPFGGQADLAAGVIRCVGEPDRRFQEDALRVLRGLRLAAQLDFRLEGRPPPPSGGTPPSVLCGLGAHPGGISPSAVLSRGGADLTGLPGDGLPDRPGAHPGGGI